MIDRAGHFLGPGDLCYLFIGYISDEKGRLLETHRSRIIQAVLCAYDGESQSGKQLSTHYTPYGIWCYFSNDTEQTITANGTRATKVRSLSIEELLTHPCSKVRLIGVEKANC